MFSEKSWILYRLHPEGDKTKKIPISPITLAPCSVTDVSQWLTFAECSELLSKNPSKASGVGFVVSGEYFFIDIDNCALAGNWNPIATELLQLFNGAFVEISQSGRGLHIIGKTTETGEGIRCKSTAGFDLYHNKRFVAYTGIQARGSAELFFNEQIRLLASKYLYRDKNEAVIPKETGEIQDTEVISRLLASHSAKSALGGGPSTRDLWEGNPEVLAQWYPGDHGGFDHSRADQALLGHLAFWTGKNAEQMGRIFSESGLAREKWERDDYRNRSIQFAIENTSAVYHKPEPKPDPSNFNWFVGAADTPGFFSGCVYVIEPHKIFCPNGQLLSSEQFNAKYGGHVFALDASGAKTTSKPYDAFLHATHWSAPRADDTCFRPELPSGGIIQEEGLAKLNVYVPVDTGGTPGDVSPFLYHVKLLLPYEMDREILLAFMAAVVQYKGVKFQWMPVIQGTYGNGKSFIIDVLANAVGWRYTHLAKSSNIANKFNAWLRYRLFIGIHELKADKETRGDVAEALKELLGQNRIEIEGKQANQYTADNRANFLGMTNYMDAVPKTKNDRRFAVFYSAQQSFEDIAACGMTGRYFPDLWNWANSGGWQKITYFLEHYTIPEELNPAGVAIRAPSTSSEEAAIEQSRGIVEQEILEAIREGLPGFRGGWVSSTAMQTLLERHRLDNRIPRNKRGALLATLGYYPHPALRAGRTTCITLTDGGKPALYLTAGHAALQLSKGRDIVDAYDGAQRELTMLTAVQ